jgi:hypothetical protein
MSLLVNEILFDRDDTFALVMNSDNTTVGSTLSQATLANFRSVSANGNVQTNNSRILYLFFPAPVDLRAVWIQTGQTNPRMHFSKDSAAPHLGAWFNCADGASMANPGSGTNFPPSRSRGNIANASQNPDPVHASATDVVAVRFRPQTSGISGGIINDLRLWGIPSAPQRSLLFWDDTLDQEAPDDLFSFGQIDLGSTNEIDFRLKNAHDTEAATNVTLSTPNQFGANNPANNVEFSDDNGSSWDNPLNIGTVASNSISGVLKVRRVVGGGESLASGMYSILTDGTWS